MQVCVRVWEGVCVCPHISLTEEELCGNVFYRNTCFRFRCPRGSGVTRVSRVAGVAGRGDGQGHAGGRQHVHVLQVPEEGSRREEVRATSQSEFRKQTLGDSHLTPRVSGETSRGFGATRVRGVIPTCLLYSIRVRMCVRVLQVLAHL